MNHKQLMDKVSRMIDSTPIENKKMLTRYISLANRRLHSYFDESGDWGIIGGSMALKKRYEAKFGLFIPANSP